jgi:adenosylcobinamide-phosphate synthase
VSASAAFALVAGMGLDEALGDPARFHPVAGFGQAALHAERVFYRPTRAAGIAYTATCVAVPTIAATLVARRLPRAPFAAAALVIALGGRTLRRTATRLADLVAAGDLDGARDLASHLVSRRAEALDGPQLARAALESLAENTADAVAGPLVWTAIAGAPGAIAYRAVNTLDAMVGYRSDRYREFGWASARLDDALNWPVARLTAAATVAAAPLVGADAAGAVRAWRRDGHRHPSPNAGRVEAAFAGALGVRLGGASTYGDRLESRPRLGDEDAAAPDPAAVHRAARLSAATGWVLTAALATAIARRPWR